MHPCRVNRINIGGDEAVRLMGVINCSPESFFQGSYVPPAEVRARAEQMVEQGADLIDIGARSTAPGSPQISWQTEANRMQQALAALDGSGITVCVDTMHRSVLECCLEHDIHAANDISGLADPGYARMLARSGLPAFLMASLHMPGDARTFTATMEALDCVVARCSTYEISRYVLDPGIGLWVPGRTPSLDWELCRNFHSFSGYGRPLLAAVSRKTFIGNLVQKPPEGRLSATLGLTALLIREGASVIRSHDIAETADVIRVAAQMEQKQ